MNDVSQKFVDKFKSLSRLTQEKIESSLIRKNTDYIQGYNDAIDNTCKWLRDYLKCLNETFGILYDSAQIDVESKCKHYKETMEDLME